MEVVSSVLSLVRREKVALLALQKGRLVGRAKPNVPLVRWQKFIFCAVGCFIFSWVGLCVVKLVCWSVS
jgi:hypothetical protein